MITYFFIEFLLNTIVLITLPVLLLPNVSLPAFVASAITSTGNYFSLGYQIFPIFCAALITAIIARLIIENYHFVFKVVMWIKELIW